jgi:HK97 gp10 family phage protein
MADIKFNGIDDLRKQLKKNMNMDDVKKVIKANGAELQQRAMRDAPVDTGALKRSIQLDIRDGGMSAHVNPTQHYAPYLEYGTRFMAPRPFLRQNFFFQRYQFIRDLEKLMK